MRILMHVHFPLEPYVPGRQITSWGDESLGAWHAS